MLHLPAPLPPLGAAIAAQVSSRTSPDEAFGLLWDHRLFALVDAREFPQLSAPAREELQMRLDQTRTQATMRHAAMCHDLAQAVHALKNAGVYPVALKGAALAGSLYPSPEARPSIDIDLLIPAESVDTVHRIMEQLGWDLPSGVRGSWVSGQFSYRSRRSPALATTLDFHWRLTNRPRLNAVLDYPQVYAQAVDNHAKFPFCHSIHPVHAFVHAIVHVVAHHRNEAIPALWWLDIGALDTTLSPQERREAMAILRGNGLYPLAAKVMFNAEQAIGLSLSKELQELRARPATRRVHWQLMPSSRAQEIAADLAALSPQLRLAYARELLFPPEASLRAAYGPADTETPLWKLHARRWRERGVRPRKT